MRAMLMASLFIMTGCDYFTENIETRQAYMLYTAGEYSVFEDCPNSGNIEGIINLGQDRVRIDHTVCDIASIQGSNVLAGIQMVLKSCRSDGEVPPSATITIEHKDKATQLHGWFTTPKRIYSCSK